MKILKKLRSFASMPASLRWMVAEAFFVAAFVESFFRVLSVGRLQSFLRLWTRARRRRTEPAPADVIRRTLRAQRVVRRNSGLGTTCLIRSLTLWALARRRGVEVELRIGVRKRDGRIEGHAWVAWQGEPVNDDPSLIATYSAYEHPISFDAWA